MPFGSLHRIQRDLRGVLPKRAKDAPGMKPAHALVLEQVIPINVTRRQL